MDRVEFNVALAGKHVPIGVDQRSMETPFPQGSRTLLSFIHPPNVGAIYCLHHPGQPAGCIRRHQQVNVIAHQHIGVNPAILLVRVMTQQAQVGDAVAIRKEYGLTIVAALDDMLRISGRIDPSWPRHGLHLVAGGQSPSLRKGI